MENIEFNKKCVEFLKWKNLNNDNFPEYLNLKNEFYPLKNLLFDSDWNWIMEIIEKIEDLDAVASFQIEQPTIYIWAAFESSTFEDISVDIFDMSKKEAVCKAIDKFLDWYNLNK